MSSFKEIAKEELLINQLENIIRVMNRYGESDEKISYYEQKLAEHRNNIKLIEEKNLKEG